MKKKDSQCPEVIDFLASGGGRRDLRHCRLDKRHKGKHRFQVGAEKMKTGKQVMGEFFWA